MNPVAKYYVLSSVVSFAGILNCAVTSLVNARWMDEMTVRWMADITKLDLLVMSVTSASNNGLCRDNK